MLNQILTEYPARRSKRVTAKWDSLGAVAQLGERLICIQEAVGSIPISSTSYVVGSKHLNPRIGRVAQVARARP